MATAVAGLVIGQDLSLTRMALDGHYAEDSPQRAAITAPSVHAAVAGPHHVWNNVKKPLVYLLSGALVATTVVGGGAYAAAHKTVTLDIDGTTTQVTTFAGSVGGVLEENDIVLGEGDLVVPSTNSVLSKDSEVIVRYQREVTVERDGELETFKTTALDADELLAGMSTQGDDVVLVASRSRGQERVDLGLRLNTDGPVAVLVDGRNTILEEGHGEVADILRTQGIVLGDDDRLSIQTLPIGAISVGVTDEETAQASDDDEKSDDVRNRAGGRDGETLALALDGNVGEIVTLVIQRVDITSETKKTKIDFETKTVKDDTRFEDLGKLVRTAGKKGESVATYEVVTVDGVKESRKKVSEELIAEPVDEVVVVGTKERPVVVTTPRSSSSNSGSSSSNSSSSSSSNSSGNESSSDEQPQSSSGDDVWAKLAQCESSGNPTVVSSNGLYHGLYQFSVSTWKSVGGTGLPSQATPAEQLKRAKMLQARSGWGQWPHCSKKLGLR